jgi:folate-dependent phosphoribosylglycinamide formyltransferase PurN
MTGTVFTQYTGLEGDYKVITNDASEWGQLIIPDNLTVKKEGLRIVVFGSTTAMILVLETLDRMNKRFPGKINLRAIATDDPLDPGARIFVRKRIWRYYSTEEKSRLLRCVINTALSYGIPCYTGGVKNDYFRDILRSWDPEVIVMCCFGQKIDAPIYEYPPFGMYNFHPSDLASDIGAGAEPYIMTIENGRTTSNMILHKVTETIDEGPIVGISPVINIALANGKYPDSILSLQEKIPSICGWMTYGLVTEILKKKEKGEKGSIESIDFESIIPSNIKKLLLKPASNAPDADYKLPYP